MGGANGKSLHTSSTNIQSYDINDPRSPSMKRTPLNTPEPADWRQKAIRARMAAKEDPRSPTNGIERTPVSEGHLNIADPVTPLTLSYGDRKINPEDPRSPKTCRTPLNQAQAILKYDISEVVDAPFNDDVIVSEREVVETSELDETISVSSSCLINNPLAGMTILSSTEAVGIVQDVVSPKEEEERESILEVDTPEVGRRGLAQSEQDIEVPSSPLGASACRLEDSQEREKDKEKRLSSPGLPSDRKRKKGNQLIGVSPLKKSFSSPSIVDENDENAANAPRRTTPTTPRRATPTTPTTTRRATPPQKRTPNTARCSSNLKNTEGTKSPRSPLSPLVPRRNAENLPPAFLL